MVGERSSRAAVDDTGIISAGTPRQIIKLDGIRFRCMFEPSVDEVMTSSHSWLRAAFLAVVWSLPGVWCAVHLLAHELEHEHHEVRPAAYAGHHVTGMSNNHDHSHSHPVSRPAISTDGAKKLSNPALLTAAIDFDSSSTNVKWYYRRADWHTVGCALAAFGPRAPPIS